MVECGTLGSEADEFLLALDDPKAPQEELAKVGTFSAKLHEAAQPQDTLLEQISPAELSRLGFNAYGFARITRLSLRRLRSHVATAPLGDVSKAKARKWLKTVTKDYFHCAVNCRKLSELMQHVANEGVAHANEREAPKTVSAKEIAEERERMAATTRGISHRVSY
jgi:hypothetical protein